MKNDYRQSNFRQNDYNKNDCRQSNYRQRQNDHKMPAGKMTDYRL